MTLLIDVASNVPVFEQIVREVKSAIARGAKKPGEGIPSIRKLAEELLVNPNTVAKAYRELERDGVIYTRKGLGVFVADGAIERCLQERAQSIREDLHLLVTEAKRAGMSAEELQGVFHEAVEAVEEEKELGRKE